jgi:hypothetical protein
MLIDIYSYTANNNQKTFDEYVEMTNGDGYRDNFYTPENYEFVNGKIVNYWE